MVYITLIVFLFFSFVLALRSMRDFDVPEQLKHLLKTKNIRGTIVFFKDKIEHHSSLFSSSSSS